MLEIGSTQMHVARGFDVQRTQISCLWTRYRETESVKDPPRSGRPKVRTLKQDHHIRLQHLRNRFLQATETARTTVGTHGRPVNEHTIRRHTSSLSWKGIRRSVCSNRTMQDRMQQQLLRSSWPKMMSLSFPGHHIPRISTQLNICGTLSAEEQSPEIPPPETHLSDFCKKSGVPSTRSRLGNSSAA